LWDRSRDRLGKDAAYYILWRIRGKTRRFKGRGLAV
jgi:hypothetical protein